MANSTIHDLKDRLAGFESCVLRRDTDGVQQFIDPEYAVVLIQPTRMVVPRERWLKTLQNYLIEDYQVEDEVLDVNGDLALLLQRLRMKATVLGKDRSGIFIHTDVWRRADQWRIWRRHSTPLSAGPYPRAD